MKYAKLDPTLTKFGVSKRFDYPDTKPEKYVKTTGMSLGNNFDKTFVKRIPFSLDHSSGKLIYILLHLMYKIGDTKTPLPITSNVNVDASYLFSTEHVVNKCPIKYSASFRSNAKVGLFIPPTTSPDHIGICDYFIHKYFYMTK